MTIRVATLCYIIWQEKMLLLYRNKKQNDIHAGKYVGIGGKVDEGETPSECVKREVKEETGLEVEPILRGLVDWPSDGVGEHWLVFIYLAKGFSGKQITECNEGVLEWVKLPEVEKRPMGESSYTVIKNALDESKKFFYSEITFKNGKLVSDKTKFY